VNKNAKIRGPACKPGSVPEAETAPATVIYLGDGLPRRSSGLPESR